MSDTKQIDPELLAEAHRKKIEAINSALSQLLIAIENDFSADDELPHIWLDLKTYQRKAEAG